MFPLRAAAQFAVTGLKIRRSGGGHRDPWIDPVIRADIADRVAFSGEIRQLPKLLIRGKRILHGQPSGEADFIRVMEQELGL